MQANDSTRNVIEKAVLSCLLQDSTQIPKADEALQTDHFRQPFHASLFRALVQHNRIGETTNVPTLVREVASATLIDEADAAAMISEILLFAPMPTFGSYYMNLLTEPDEPESGSR